MAAILVIGTVTPASAAGFADFLNNILNEFNAIRTPIAIIAIMLVGVAYLFNMVDLRRTAYVIIGIIVIFGAAEILKMVTG